MSLDECLNANYQHISLRPRLASHNKNNYLSNTMKENAQDLVPIMVGSITDNETNFQKTVKMHINYVRRKQLKYYWIVERVL